MTRGSVHTDKTNALYYSTKKHGENAPETADLYFAYGKALLENAIAQSGVLGKQDQDDSFDEDQGVYRVVAHHVSRLTLSACLL